jgi:hypothetical protein
MGLQHIGDRYISELLQQVSTGGQFTTLAQVVDAAGLANSLDVFKIQLSYWVTHLLGVS